jgi:hypothetical protein
MRLAQQNAGWQSGAETLALDEFAALFHVLFEFLR